MEIVVIIGALFVLVSVVATLVRYDSVKQTPTTVTSTTATSTTTKKTRARKGK